MSMIPECRHVGHSVTITSNNPGSRSSSEAEYVDFKSDLSALHNTCSGTKEELTRYTCAYFYPECNSDGIPYKPCRSFCYGKSSTWNSD